MMVFTHICRHVLGAVEAPNPPAGSPVVGNRKAGHVWLREGCAVLENRGV